jgi:hypothetical protein
LLPPIAGILFPIPALVGVVLMLITRVMFSIGYINWKMRACRVVGHIIFTLCIFMLITCAIMTAAKIIEVGDAKYNNFEKKYVDGIDALKVKYGV